MEGPDVTPNITETTVQTSAKKIIYRHLENKENVDALLDTLNVLAGQMGHAQGQELTRIAHDLLGEVVTEALKSSKRYDPNQSKPRTWLNGIARNVVRHKLDKKATRAKRIKELSFSELRQVQEGLSDNELLERLPDTFTEGPEKSVESDEQFETLLSSLSEDDKHLLRLYIRRDFDAPLIASELGITHEAARQRISRALKQLRILYGSKGGELL